MARLSIFYDSEFTGLTQSTTLISIALTTEDGRSFYAEFTDFDKTQVDDFISQSVLANTQWLVDWQSVSPEVIEPKVNYADGAFSCVGPTQFVRDQLLQWIEPLGEIQVWADHVSYDWVLFCELFGGALALPSSIYYIPMDLCTWMSSLGHNPDCDRVEFAKDFLNKTSGDINQAHNALFDARVSLACYQRLMSGVGSERLAK